MKSVYYILTTLISLLVMQQVSYSQTISFCEDIKPDGQMIRPNIAFTIARGGGTIKMLVNLKIKVNGVKVVYKVYRLDDKGKKYPDQTINDIVKPEWLWFYTDLFLRSAGNYLVELYLDGSNNILASGKVRILEDKE